MNSVTIIGRLTRDPDMYEKGENTMAKFNVAVDRPYKKEGQPSADFISCVAFGKTAEFIGKYFGKGKQIALTGSIRTGSYEKDGAKVYTTDILVDRVEFVGSKSDEKKDEKKDDRDHSSDNATEYQRAKKSQQPWQELTDEDIPQFEMPF